MPLNFLTADHAPVVPAHDADRPLPHEERARWRRPYRLGPWRVAGAAVVLLLTSYVLISAVILAVAGQLTGAAAFAAVAALMTAAALRALRMGVWVSDAGLRQVGPLYTVTLPWAEVSAVRTAQQPVKWLGLPRTVQGQALVVERTRGGSALRTQLTTHNADFLNRPEAFDRAADVIEGWSAEARGVQGEHGAR
ncbi:hypothetical protein E4198_05070 [Streptomyces sp. RKND-216]|uniref:hypothetical protein n=1 Tax=Streptomyces sp. RKND-216 TaxID=2562581 RepID=UPI00109DDCBE|nr:hypothetical protein [Streptomyces sp. RKND-216]THA24193.1 hypothetical protein E4198_05070 [Streptomyces sp. RKND-216]